MKEEIIKNRYKLLREPLTQGGMSKTYFAEDLKSKKEVVVKFFKGQSQQLQSRFIREIKILKKHKSSGFIIPILDFDVQYEPPFFVMPKANCDLLTLDKLSIQESKRHFYRMLDCVEFIHNNRAFHRDIKPENFLIYKGKVMCSDFGLAKDSQLTQLTKLKEFGGTECYMPPEFKIEDGFQNPQKSSDLYSLGKTFYFLLTKKIPAYIEQGTIPDVLYKVIKKATNENPAQRYQTCFEFKNALKEAYNTIDQQTSILVIRPAIRKKGLEESIKNYNDLIKKNPNNIEAYYNRGLDKHDLGKYKEAIEDFNKVIEFSPNFFVVYNNRGNANSELEKYKEAIEDYDKAIKLNPKAVLVYYNRGSVKSDLGRYKEAIEDYNKAIQLNPYYAEAYNSRASIKYNSGKHEEAIEDYNKAIQLNPYCAETYNNLGLIKTDLEEYKKAITYYNKAIQLNPHFGTYYGRGLARSALARTLQNNTLLERIKSILNNLLFPFYNKPSFNYHEEAIKDFNTAIKLSPYSPEIYSGRGDVKSDLERYEEAIKDYNKSIELNPHFFGAYNNRGLAKYNLGKHTEAIKDFNEALKLDPNYVAAYYNRGLAKSNIGEYREAIADFNKVIELKPNHSDAYHNRGIAKEKLGRYKEATLDFKKAIKLESKLN